MPHQERQSGMDIQVLHLLPAEDVKTASDTQDVSQFTVLQNDSSLYIIR